MTNNIEFDRFNFCNILYDSLFDFDIENHAKLFNSALLMWTKRTLLEKYNKSKLKFYDGVIGYVIANGNDYYKIKMSEMPCYIPDEILSFFNIWQYNGTLYRVIDAPKSKIRFHKMIASWTKSVNAFDGFNHLDKNKKYTFLIAKTNDYFGFDVNKYRSFIGEKHPNTESEEEIIFPMDKKYITDMFYGTLEEFKEYLLCSV